MKKKTPRNSLVLALILTYSLAIMCLGLVQKPLTPNEAQNIYMGRAILSEGILACNEPSNGDNNIAIKEMMCAYTGSVAVAPIVNAIMDGFAGFHLARFVGLILCLCLVLLIYLIGNTVFYGKRGLMTAAVFVLLGIPLYLSPSANADGFVAFFFGASLWFIESAAEYQTTREKAFMLLTAALALSLAVITNYIVILFVISVVLYVFLRHRVLAASVFFLLPLLAILLLYGYLAILPAWPYLKNSLYFSLAHLDENASLKFNYIYDWLALPYLLATFGMFHKGNGKTAFFLMLLSSPAFLIPFISNDIGSTHSVVLLFLIFIIPAVAMGVEHMGDLFSSYNQMSFVKPLFIIAVLVIIFVFGFQQIKKLKQDCPDLSPAVTFFQGNNIPGMTVLVDSGYGEPEYLYRYFLESGQRSVRIVPIVRGNDKERGNILMKVGPDYVVVDEYYSNILSFEQASLDYVAHGFTIIKNYQMTLSSGLKNIRIFQKGAL